MVFSSLVFLFAFLPLVLAAYQVLPLRWQNALLLSASLFFYAWGEALYVALMLVSISANWGFGRWLLWLDERSAGGHPRRLVVTLAVGLNLGLLGFFKYGGFVVENTSAVLTALGFSPLPAVEIHLPIGISFFTFQAMSYVVDVYRRAAEPQRRWVDLALYVSLFPQLIAGPIVRYRDVALQLRRRRVTLAGFALGVRRFVVGLAKKVLIANTVGVAADRVFALEASSVSGLLAWVGVLSYALQIYFDFSGYSDMAIGLGRIFGFRFRENFRYPYVAGSITDFWRRWHISLSTWFRDYLYVPLGGNRRGRLRTYLNLVLVFFLCGLWHGASWSFVVWGLFHGGFLVLERVGLERGLERLPRLLRSVYVLGVVGVGWTFFRATSLSSALVLLRAMAGGGAEVPWETVSRIYLSHDVVVALSLGCVAALPVVPAIRRLSLRRRAGSRRPTAGLVLRGAMEVGSVAAVFALFVASAIRLVAGTHNPFIYFRF